jgi:hypothetical protein
MKVLNHGFVEKLAAKGRRRGAPTKFRIHKQPAPDGTPRVSIILLDWSCREHLHALKWLERQNVPRDEYELIWIELYDRVLPEALRHCDVVITVGQQGMYHKHVGYNVGLLVARGRIVTVCDSDAVFPENFIRSIMASFRDHTTGGTRSLVLMHHELRTSQPYPLDLIEATELQDHSRWQWWDITPNAGACMSVLRSDALRLGGFDECPSYRGYLCGPYDLGWRMVNAGIPEIWHDLSTVLWHFAHPDPIGTNGIIPAFRRILENTYPHVDLHALTAVEHFSAGRLLPNRENPQIHAIRMARRQVGTDFERKYCDLTGPGGFTRTALFVLRSLMFIDLIATIVHSGVLSLFRKLTHSIRPLGRRILGQKLADRLVRWRRERSAREPVLVEESEHFNIVLYRKKYYGVPKSLGEVDFADPSQLAQTSICRSRLRSLVKWRMRPDSRHDYLNAVKE